MAYPNYYQPMAGAYGPQPVYGPYPVPNVQQPSAQPQPQVQAQTVQQPVMSQPAFVCRPVASVEEAMAVPTDFNGNVIVMTDLGHKYIYTKVLNPATGSSVFEKYRKEDDGQGHTEAPHEDKVPAVDYTPHFTALEERLDQMSDRVEDLFDRIESQKKAAMRAERKAGNAE